jgi:CRP-like cAMP-binding protein
VSVLTMVQAEMDVCYRLALAPFRREMDRGGAFAQMMMRFAQAQTDVLMQSTACNTIHSVERRLARWLLTAHDRVGRDEFALTQEFVAMMLGVTRPTVTLVAGALQKSGLIRYRRGRLAILDRQGLEKASCECYGAMSRIMRSVVERPPQA